MEGGVTSCDLAPVTNEGIDGGISHEGVDRIEGLVDEELLLFFLVALPAAAAAGGLSSLAAGAASASTAPDVPGGGGGGGGRGGRMEGGREAPVFEEGLLYLFRGGLAKDVDWEETREELAFVVFDCFEYHLLCFVDD